MYGLTNPITICSPTIWAFNNSHSFTGCFLQRSVGLITHLDMAGPEYKLRCELLGHQEDVSARGPRAWRAGSAWLATRARALCAAFAAAPCAPAERLAEAMPAPDPACAHPLCAGARPVRVRPGPADQLEGQDPEAVGRGGRLLQPAAHIRERASCGAAWRGAALARACAGRGPVLRSGRAARPGRGCARGHRPLPLRVPGGGAVASKGCAPRSRPQLQPRAMAPPSAPQRGARSPASHLCNTPGPLHALHAGRAHQLCGARHIHPRGRAARPAKRRRRVRCAPRAHNAAPLRPRRFARGAQRRLLQRDTLGRASPSRAARRFAGTQRCAPQSGPPPHLRARRLFRHDCAALGPRLRSGDSSAQGPRLPGGPMGRGGNRHW